MTSVFSALDLVLFHHILYFFISSYAFAGEIMDRPVRISLFDVGPGFWPGLGG